MPLFDSMHISTSALTVERKRMEVISDNIANVNSPRDKEGYMYQPRRLVSGPAPGAFTNHLADFRELPRGGVEILGIHEENNPPRMEYNPSHPYADKNGFVAYPDVNILDEMVNATIASRNYQANLTTFNEAKKMFNRALDIGK